MTEIQSVFYHFLGQGFAKSEAIKAVAKRFGLTDNDVRRSLHRADETDRLSPAKTANEHRDAA